ncbi:MAG: metallopeptidase family protein [Hyphomicrobiaceae bacterium]|nr:metallopeptidase family protein [Hyphomicrobiaceae bacterium]
MSVSNDGTCWENLAAPSLDDFERLAKRAYAGLPEQFRALCGDVVIVIQDFATDDAIASVNVTDPFELMGLYQGISLDRKGSQDIVEQPDMVFLYRRAILDYWAECGNETLADLVTHVLVHEIGHHFGLSDDDMERLEAAATTAV